MLLLTGCGRRHNADNSIVLEFWDFPHMPGTMDYVQKAIETFEHENPGVRIKYTRLPWQDGQQKISLAVNAGDPPDIATQVNVSPQFLAQDVLEPLDEYLAPLMDDFYPEYLAPVRWMNHIYGVPWYKACYVCVLNLDVFESRGVALPVDGRWTWDEFRSKMKALTVNDGPTSQTWGLVTNLGPMEYEAYSIIYNTDDARIMRVLPDGSVKSAVAEDAFIKGIKRLQQLEFEDRVTVPTIGSMTQEQSWNVWRDTKRVGVTFQGAWCVTGLHRYNESIEENNARKIAEGRANEVESPIRWKIVAPPSDDAETTPVLGSSGLGTFVVFKQKDKVKRDLAVKLALQLIKGEGQQVLIEENCHPSLKSAGDLWANQPDLSPVFKLFPEGVVMPLVPGGERVDPVLQTEIQKAVLAIPGTGKPQLDAETCARAGDAKVKAILERAERRNAESGSAR